jgi:hypothetical protein
MRVMDSRMAAACCEAETGGECDGRDCDYLAEFHCLAFPRCRKASFHSLFKKCYAAYMLVPRGEMTTKSEVNVT